MVHEWRWPVYWNTDDTHPGDTFLYVRKRILT